LIFALQEENLRVTGVVVSNDKTYHLPHMERTREESIVSIRSNSSGCSVITVLTEEWEVAIILP
jgi:hypothetical protein